MLLGVLDPSAGQVLYQGFDVRELEKEEQRHFRQDVQAIFQDPFEVYTPFYKIDHILTTPIQPAPYLKGKHGGLIRFRNIRIRPL